MGPFPDQLLEVYTDDPATHRVLEAETDFETLAYEPDATSYTYNLAGDVTSVSDVERTSSTASTTQTQCFAYGGSGELASQLTAAWTDTGGTQTAASPVINGIGRCVHASPAAANIGGPAPYWETWTNDLAGDRTSQTAYDTSLPAAQDTLANATVAQTTYPGGNLSSSPSSNAATTPQSQPDAAQAVTTTDPAGTSVLTASYKTNGATVAERSSGPGPLISAIMNAAKFCVEDSGGVTTNGTKVDLGSCNGSASQSWSVGFGSGGNVKTGGGAHCLTVQGNGTTAGTLVEIDGCTAADAAGQKWVAGANGALVNPNSGMCLDDPNGVKTVGTQLDIAACNGMPRQDWSSEPVTYTADQHVASVTTPTSTGTQTASYSYDADGNLIAQAGPASDTIYLLGGAEQVTYIPGAKPTTIAQWFYTAPDGTSVVRTVTTAGSTSASAMTYEVANPQGTAEQSWTTGGVVTRRYYDPYGQQIGTPPSWPDNHDFLGRPQDAVTGLDLLGARQYNPASGAFLSLDPVFEPGDPLAMGGYAYAGDNPVNGTDPSGLQVCLTNGDTCQPDPTTGSYGGGSGGVAEGSGGYGGGGGYSGGSGQAPGTGVLPPAARAAYQRAYQDYAATNAGQTGAELEVDALEAYCAASESACGRSLTVALWADYEASKAPMGIFMDPGLSGGGDIADIRYTAMQQTDELYLAELNPGDTPALKAGAGEESRAVTCGGASFTAGTKVLLASGKAVRISRLKPGDKVLATSTRTGKTSAEPVTAVLVHFDTDRYDLTIKAAGGIAIVQTTRNHLFWDQCARRWVTAGTLSYGAHLGTPGVVSATVQSGKASADAVGWMWDLSVPGGGDHDFYILVVTTAVLVHNCGPEDPFLDQEGEKYVRYRHFPGGDEVDPSKGIFNADENPPSLVEAAGSSEPVGPNANGYYERMINANRIYR